MLDNLTASISLVDNFTPQLRNISNALSTVSTTLNSLDFDKGFDSKACKEMSNAAKALDKSIGDLEKESDQAAKKQDKHNKSLNEGKSSADKLTSGFKGLVGAIGGVVGTYASIQGIKSVLNWSDEISQTTSRLNLVNESFNQINGTAQTTKDLQDKIFLAAQNSRGSYKDLQNLVASIGNNAKDAFSNTDEIVKFAQNLNKTFAISGASAEEMSNATLQLTQGLASGTLRGDELNSVLENAPELINVIANSMGVPRGEIRNLAAEGKITAEVVKNALINSSDEINAKFQSMPMTFGQAWTQVSNSLQHAFEPVAQTIGELASSPEFQAALEQLSTSLTDLAPKIKELAQSIVEIAPGILQTLVDGLSWFLDNGSTIIPIIAGIATAFGTLSIISSIAGMLSALGVAITIPLAPIALVVAAIAGIGVALAVLWNNNEDFRNGVMAIWDAIVGAVTNAYNNIVGFFSSLGEGFDEAVVSLQNLGTEISNIFSGWYNNALTWGQNLLQGLKDGLTAKWNEITGWFTDSFNWVVNNVKSIFGIASPSTVFSDIGNNLIQGFLQGLQGMWQTVTDWATSAWDTITSIFGGGGTEESGTTIDFTAANQQLDDFNNRVTIVFNEINQKSIALGQTMVSNICSGLGSLPLQISSAFAVTQAAIQIQVASIVNTAIAGFNALIPAVSSIFATIATQSVGLLNNFSANASAIVSGLITSISGVVTGLAQSFINIFSTIVKNTTDSLTLMSGQAISIMGTMVSGIIVLFGTLTSSLVTSFSTFNINMIAALGSLQTSFSNTWTLIKSNTATAVGQLCDNTLRNINKLAADIVTAMSKLPSEFGRIAGEMMASLKAGIDNNKQSIIDSTSQLVEQLKTTFQTGLGIHSPSDYMIWVGQMMLAGLIEGLSSSQIQSFIESTIKDMQASFEAGNFNATETMDFLSQQGALDLIAKVTGMDLSAVENSPASIPGIIQAAQKHVGYKSGATSIFGEKYGNPTGAWCAYFVRAMAEEAGVPFPASGYVPEIMSWAQQNGRWTQTPQSGYAAIYGGGSHIELVKSIDAAGNVITIGGNTGTPRGVYEHIRNGATGYVALDGGHGVGNTLQATLQNAYNAKYNPMAAMGAAGGVGGVALTDLGSIGYPLASMGTVTSVYGYRVHPLFGVGRGHDGIDLAAPTGTPIKSATSGRVSLAGVYGGYGNAVMVDSGGAQFLYGHMSAITTSTGAQVSQGQQIGLVGSTGWSTGPHLHFEIRSGGGTVDPLDYLIAAGQTGYATGTPSAVPGLHWVGETGPELVQFNGGERVYTSQESRALVQGRREISTSPAGNSSIPVTVNVNVGTINNAEETIGTLDQFKDMFIQVIDDVIYNEPKGLARG